MVVYKVFKIIDVFIFVGMVIKFCIEFNIENLVNFGV